MTRMRIAITGIILILLFLTYSLIPIKDKEISSDRLLADVEYQVSLGPRIIGSQAHVKTQEYIQMQLKKAGWNFERQEGIVGDGIEITNLIGKRGKNTPWIVFGAHYDSRMIADHDIDPENWTTPVPGANDGASGVAVLLELARVLPRKMDARIWLVFFDAEDNGNIEGYDWIMGSHYFVDHLDGAPDQAIIVDMVGDNDLNIFFEKNSDPSLSNEIWSTANSLGHSQFIPQEKYRIIDDHIPFIQKGIRAVDIIDFDYPYYHTTEDTIDKISPASLTAVVNTLLNWVINLEQE